jgi:hypothetical protein
MTPRQQADARLAELRRSPNRVHYCTEAPLGTRADRWISIEADCLTGETFVIVTDGRISRIRSFLSRHKSCPPEERRKNIPLVDLADAFALGRKLCSSWRG